MDTRQFGESLIQVLETYQRLGVRRFPAIAHEDLPSDLKVALESLSQPVITGGGTGGSTNTERAASSEGANAVEPLPTPQARTANSQSSASASRTVEIAQPTDGIAAQPWSLPVLPVEKRSERFGELSSQAAACRLCSEIVGFRKQTVWGEGNLKPRLCFVGEAPGADEDRTGRPFVGRAGQLLTKIISAMGIDRDEVFILNALKCRPPQNRTPVPEEVGNCRGFLTQQLDTLQPEFIVCLGAVAVRSLLQTEAPVGRLRKKFHSYRGAKVVVTYHPSYLLRNAEAKRLVWDDMKMLMSEMGLPLPK